MRDDHRNCCDLLFKVRCAHDTLRALEYLVDGRRGGLAEADSFALLARLVRMEQAARILETRIIGRMPASCLRRILAPADPARTSPPGSLP
jgi:hypothetical protein